MMVAGLLKTSCRLGALAAFALSLGLASAAGEDAKRDAKRPWLDPTLLAAAQKEGPLVVYSSMNEREGLPLFKIFTDATGIKVNYVRAADTPLMSRIAIEFRAKQKTWDILQTTTINKVPPAMLAQIDPSEAKALSPDARDPGRRWYGMYANYNAPAYNTKLVQPSELPKTYEDFISRKQWVNRVAIDGTDNEWLKAMFEHYGEKRATEIIKGIVSTLKPVVTDGHLAMARATGAGEYAISLNNYVNLSMNVKLAGGPIGVWAMDPVALMFGQVGVSALAPNPNAAKLAANFMLSQEAQQFIAKFGRLPTRSDVADNPPGTIAMLRKKKVIPVLLKPEEEKVWQRRFQELFRPR
ncbi:MAG: extracellular solute-binding protein [Rhizobiales bacterium]|nr:extracellular solute-binding protein [Hyphomicrobiales bacterium]